MLQCASLFLPFFLSFFLSFFMSSLCHVTLIVSFLLSFLTFHLSMYVDFKPKRPYIIPSLLTVCLSFLATTYFQSIIVYQSLHIPQLYFILPTFHGFKLAMQSCLLSAAKSRANLLPTYRSCSFNLFITIN